MAHIHSFKRNDRNKMMARLLIWLDKGVIIINVALNALRKRETYCDVYPKGPNSWIHNIGFKPLLLTLIF